MEKSNCWEIKLLVKIAFVMIGILLYNLIKNDYIKYSIYRMEKLTITLSYDENQGLPVTELSDYLLSINNAYHEFSGKNATLYIKSISKGSIIIELTKHIISPIFLNLYVNSLYDFGKSLICDINDVLDDKHIVEKVYKGDAESLKKVNNAVTVVGDKNTVNNIYLVASNGKEQHEKVITKEDIVKVNDLGKLINETTKKVELYESQIIQFDSISNKSNYFKGIIKSIDPKYKKVIFESETVKDSFNFNQFDFNQKYLVSVKVHYNTNGTIAKYCVMENLGLDKE